MGLMGAEGNSTLGGLLKRGGAPHKEAPTLPRSLVLPAFGSFRFFGLQPQADSGSCPAEIISTELMTSDRKLKASREGSKWRIYGT